MKTYLLLIALVLIFLSVLTACNQTPKRHIGTWEGKKNSGAPVSLTLYDDNHIKLVENDKIILSKEEQTVAGKSVESKYEINYKETPIWLDFIIYNGGDKMQPYKNAINFLSNDEMELVNAEGGTVRLNKIDKDSPEYALLKKNKE